jgi:hypothetical protein
MSALYEQRRSKFGEVFVAQNVQQDRHVEQVGLVVGSQLEQASRLFTDGRVRKKFAIEANGVL